MDRKSWPWKKKSSDKAAAEKAAASSESAETQGDPASYKKPTFVQISVESYSHLSSLEDQVKTQEEQITTLESQIEELNEKLSAAHSEVTTKDDLVKQHSKVAEEAVSGWEKAEAEALALKSHLENVTLSKLTAEDRAAHLDDALKECMRQIRNLKEEHENKLQDVIFTKTKQWDKVRLEFEAKISSLDQELMRSDAENAAISRSLQERSNMFIKISEEKLQAEAEIELLKGNIESLEREINSQKYELHVVSKELEIRNEEKNMSIRSADAANKQHMEGVKKIAKLEAECQRLRGLVRKKLPGPAALAQMKLEVENLGRDYGDVRIRPPVGTAMSHTSPEFTLHNIQKLQKENDFLTERLIAMEEETKMLKEALAKRNSDLQTSRSLCAKTASRLQVVETQLQYENVQKSSPKSVVHFTTEGFSSQSHLPSLTSKSEDANDEERSSVRSWATGLSSENSQFMGKKNDKLSKTESENHLELMDDFLEMEKLACISNDSNRGISILENLSNKVSEIVPSEEFLNSKIIQSDRTDESTSSNNASSFKVESLAAESEEQPLTKLRSRICLIFESIAKDSDKKKVMEDIKHVVQDAHDALYQHSGCLSGGSKDLQDSVATGDRQANPDDAGFIAEKEIALSQTAISTENKISKDLEAAISRIHDFVLFVGKESIRIHDTSVENDGLNNKIEEFSNTFDEVIHSNTSLADFILELSNVLSEASSLRFGVLSCEGDGEAISPDCIDKVALPENKVVQKSSSSEKYQNGYCHISPHITNLEVPDDGNLVLNYESNPRLCKVLPEELEELKSERDNLKVVLGRSNEDLEAAKSKLQETEQLLAEVKSQLASAQKSNSLAETQLKCMAESYRSLETRAEELETQVNLLRSKTETLENELQHERCNHQEAFAKYKELQMQIQRIEISSSGIDSDLKNNQERDLVAASEKLAECQETIFLLSKQLKTLVPPTELSTAPHSETNQRTERFAENEPTMDPPSSPNLQRAGAESSIDEFNSPLSKSDTEGSFMRSPIRAKHKSSSSSSSSSTPTPEKHARGFSRFFSSK